MKLLIAVYDAPPDKEYKILIESIEKLGHTLEAFISIGSDQSFREVGDYNLYPFSYNQILKYDLLLLGVRGKNIEKLRAELGRSGIPGEKVKSFYWLLQEIITKKYEDFQDKDIQNTLNWWENNELTVFNQHMEGYQTTYDELHMDKSCGFPYIIFKTVEGKERRMYYPQDSGFKIPGFGDKLFIVDLLKEQIPTSPHLYTKGEHRVNDGDVLIDAGVCEGNFALKYADICSKIYLFETDSGWFAPLYYTFKDYWDKVEFIPKAVSEKTRGGGCIGRCNLSSCQEQYFS